MRKKYAIYGAIVTALLVMAGCTKEQPTDEKEGGDTAKGRPIEIRAFLKEGDKITPMSELRNTRAQGGTLSDGFYIYGIAGTTKWTSGTPTGQYIWNDVYVSGDGTITGGNQMWLSDGQTYHHFGAYSEVHPGTNLGFMSALSPDGTRDFRQGISPNMDLLVAEPVTNVVVASSAPVINLYFKHALSRILIKLYGSGSTPLYDVNASVTVPLDVVVRSRSLVGIFDKTKDGTTSWSKWTSYYLLSPPFSLSAANKDKEHAVFVGDLILPPYSGIYPTGWLEVKFTYSFSPGGATETVTAALPATTEGLLAGMQYTYYINYIVNTSNLTVEDVNVSNWVTEERLVDDLN